jgi:hypothetical protein
MEEFGKNSRMDKIIENDSVFKNINLNDMHFCNLLAVIEAPTGDDAVEKLIQSQPWQVFKRSDRPKPQDDNRGDGEDSLKPEDYDRFFREQDFLLNNIKITKLDNNSSFGTLKRRLRLYSDVQLSRYQISCDNQSEKIIWVYKMGDHWIICN